MAPLAALPGQRRIKHSISLEHRLKEAKILSACFLATISCRLEKISDTKFTWRCEMDVIKKITVVDAEKQAQWGKPTGRNYVRPTQTDRAHIALNCYEPGVNDELHCHPGSDHTFFVV